MNNVKISVCLATYNGAKYVIEQLHSILSQLSYDDEVIISDDHSTDNTLELIRSLQDTRIHIFMNELGKGYTRNFENAINHASGDIIFLSDQDDVWVENKVELMRKELEHYDLVVSDAMICDSQLNPTKGSHFKAFGVQQGFLINWVKTRYIGACMAFRKEILIRLLPFPKNAKLCAHDYWIVNICELFYKVKLLDVPLILYRRHDSNASGGGEKSTNSLSHKLKVRAYTLYQLSGRL